MSEIQDFEIDRTLMQLNEEEISMKPFFLVQYSSAAAAQGNFLKME